MGSYSYDDAETRKSQLAAANSKQAAESNGSPPTLGLLRGPQKNLADETLRRLGDDRFHSVRDISGLQHFRFVLAHVGRKFRGDAARADRADANPERAQVFRHTISETEQTPF